MITLLFLKFYTLTLRLGYFNKIFLSETFSCTESILETFTLQKINSQIYFIGKNVSLSISVIIFVCVCVNAVNFCLK